MTCRLLLKPVCMGGATANSPGKPFNVIDTEPPQGRLAFPIRNGSITGQVRPSTLPAQRRQSLNQQFAFIVA